MLFNISAFIYNNRAVCTCVCVSVRVVKMQISACTPLGKLQTSSTYQRAQTGEPIHDREIGQVVLPPHVWELQHTPVDD